MFQIAVETVEVHTDQDRIEYFFRQSKQGHPELVSQRGTATITPKLGLQTSQEREP
jgi:hypothetical protein